MAGRWRRRISWDDSRIALSESGGLSLAPGASKHRGDGNTVTQELCHVRDCQSDASASCAACPRAAETLRKSLCQTLPIRRSHKRCANSTKRCASALRQRSEQASPRRLNFRQSSLDLEQPDHHAALDCRAFGRDGDLRGLDGARASLNRFPFADQEAVGCDAECCTMMKDFHLTGWLCITNRTAKSSPRGAAARVRN
jgi:hypothetical protein